MHNPTLNSVLTIQHFPDIFSKCWTMDGYYTSRDRKNGYEPTETGYESSEHCESFVSLWVSDYIWALFITPNVPVWFRVFHDEWKSNSQLFRQSVVRKYETVQTKRKQTVQSAFFDLFYLLWSCSTTLKLKQTIYWVRKTIQLLNRVRDYFEGTIPLYFPKEFKSHFRMTRQAESGWHAHITPNLHLFSRL